MITNFIDNLMQNRKPVLIYCFTLLCVASWLVGTSCSNESAKVTEIRAHNHIIEGVPHALGLNHAERYCQRCHGTGLIGGQDLEPSCYSCHGKNWQDSDPMNSFAPSSHTEQYELWFHDPNHVNAESNCSACHGSNLEGEASIGVPSCFLCHEQKW